MKVIRVLMLLSLLSLVLSPIAAQAAQSTPDKGTIEWTSGRIYYPSESQASFWISYPSVKIIDIAPGASKVFRLTIGNVSESEQDINVTVESSVASGDSFQTLPSDWVVVTTERVSPDEANDVKSVDLITVPAGSVAQLWVQVSVPDKKKYKDEDFQCRIRVTEAGSSEGVDSVVTVSTADRMAGQGRKSAPFIFATLLIVIVVGGLAVYIFSRWRWPDKPKEAKEPKEKKESVQKKQGESEGAGRIYFGSPRTVPITSSPTRAIKKTNQQHPNSGNFADPNTEHPVSDDRGQ